MFFSFSEVRDSAGVRRSIKREPCDPWDLIMPANMWLFSAFILFQTAQWWRQRKPCAEFSRPLNQG
jgi:hypothetical protein